MEVGLRIKEVREKQKISQVKLAKKLKNLNQSQICKIENGQRALKADDLYQIAKVLNVSIDELMN